MHARLDALIGRLMDANKLFGLAYILFIIPIFLILLIGAVIGSFPGILVHHLLWGGCDIKNKSEAKKIAYDISLILFALISLIIFVVYVSPYLPDFSEYPCSTHPYC